MNLKNLYVKELFLGFGLVIIETLIAVFLGPEISRLEHLFQIVIIFNAYTVLKIWRKKELKLDERENILFLQSGFVSVFIFIVIVVSVFLIQKELSSEFDFSIKYIWGRFLLPCFLLIHAITGYIQLKRDEFFG